MGYQGGENWEIGLRVWFPLVGAVVIKYGVMIMTTRTGNVDWFITAFVA